MSASEVDSSFGRGLRTGPDADGLQQVKCTWWLVGKDDRDQTNTMRVGHRRNRDIRSQVGSCMGHRKRRAETRIYFS